MAAPLIEVLREAPAPAASAPGERERRAKIAQAMLSQGIDTSPVQHWTQGAARLANALVGGYMGGKVNREERASEKALSDALIGLPGLGGDTSAAPASAQPPASGGAEPNLVNAVIQQESGGNPNVVSPKGATGLMQVMPATARDPGFGVQPMDPSKLTDPAENQRFGTEYLNAMMQRYDGDLDAALVAYNAGPGRADAWIKGGKDMSLLPEETRNYVTQVKSRLGGQQTAQAAPPGTHRMPDGSVMRDDQMPSAQPQTAPQPRGPQIPAQQAAYIRALLSNPATRQMGMQLYSQYAKPQTPTDDMREYEAAKAQGYQGTLMDFIQANKKAGATSVTIDQKAPGEFGKALGKGLAENFLEQRSAAQSAVQSLQNSAEARQLLDSGIITGAGAEFITGFGKALQQAGFNVAPDAIANTEAFVATRAKEVGQIIKLFGAGTGLSDADREFATKAAAGQINMTEQSIRRILDISERASQNVIKNYNEMAAKIPEGTSPFPLAIEMPAMQQKPKDEIVDYRTYFGGQ